MIRHDETRFSTRDFHSVPFWKLDDSSDHTFHINVNHVHGDGPVANLSRIESLLATQNFTSALARMMGGSGIICRIGHVNNIVSSSDEEESDDDDDDEYRPTKRSR